MISKFFNSENDRNLWIRLNAERIQYMDFVVTNVKTDLGDINTPHTPMWISKNQLEYDEKNSNELRFTLEQFLLLSDRELFEYNFDNICSGLLEETLEEL